MQTLTEKQKRFVDFLYTHDAHGRYFNNFDLDRVNSQAKYTDIYDFIERHQQVRLFIDAFVWNNNFWGYLHEKWKEELSIVNEGKQEDIMTKKDFREGDKLYHIGSNKYFGGPCVFAKYAGSGEDGSLIAWENGVDEWVKTKHLYHDHDRKISAAVQKAIEENETKPVRKVKRWLNVLGSSEYGKCETHIYADKNSALHDSKFKNYRAKKFILIAHEIEVDEDKL